MQFERRMHRGKCTRIFQLRKLREEQSFWRKIACKNVEEGKKKGILSGS
jgi:hypothetical protein